MAFWVGWRIRIARAGSGPEPPQGFTPYPQGVKVMFLARTLCVLGLALLAILAVMWCQPPIEAGPPDDGKERPAAELLVGTWTEVSTSGHPRSWWSSDRIVYRADGTYRWCSNVPIRSIWQPSREGRYEVTDKMIRPYYELTLEDEEESGRLPIGYRRLK